MISSTASITKKEKEKGGHVSFLNNASRHCLVNSHLVVGLLTIVLLHHRHVSLVSSDLVNIVINVLVKISAVHGIVISELIMIVILYRVSEISRAP